MKKKMTELAYAKINLMLDIAGVRQDGYHLIDGVMQTVSLADTVEVALSAGEKSRIFIRVEGNDSIPQDQSNLAYRAAELFLQQTKMQGTVEINIQKRIPEAAGLAGGSADAAATLRALDRLTGKPLDMDELCALGAKIGADVPFCIRGGAMRTEGIGERLTPVIGLPDCFLVIACAGTRISTPLAYRKLDELYHGFSDYQNPAKKVENLIQVLAKGELLVACALFFNLFEAPAMQANPQIEVIRQIFTEQGALRAMMSGSGPAVFGVFSTQEQAKSACRALEARKIRGQICTPIGQENLVC